jgi:hypothetical protein
MPRKRPLTKSSATHLKKIIHDGFSGLLTVRSILAGYFRRDEKLMRKMQRIVEDYGEIQKECESEFSKKAGN